MRGSFVHRFGPFEIDAVAGRLFRGRQRIRLSTSQSAILAHLVTNAGQVISKEALIEAGWQGLAITDNALDKTISRLRKVLGGGHKHCAYIETLPHLGYRFAEPVERAERDDVEATLAARLEPYIAFVQGRTELDTLDRDAIRRVRQEFEDALQQVPDYAPAHVNLAMAHALAFESSTPDPVPDTTSLPPGLRHARRGCELAPASGDAWSALAFVLCLHGETTLAAAAACKATELEPDNWRHALRAAYVSWGEQRLRAARRVLALRPGLALAHWLCTTVFIARGALDLAFEELRIGCAAQDAQQKGTGFPAVGLHLLHALVLAAHDRLDAAVEELMRELAWADCGQLYARECASNTWYALGAFRLHQQKRAEAAEAFTRALAIAPLHVPATAALRGTVPAAARPADAFIGQAIVLACANRHADAARVYCEAVAQRPPGAAGWLLPVEPMLNPRAHAELWAGALTVIRARAS